jgi:mycothiol synthase
VEPTDHIDVVATRDGVNALLLRDPGAIGEAIAMLDAAESDAGVPLVDEAERARLHRLEDGRGAAVDGHHHALVARRDDEIVGYAGLVVPARPAAAVGDVALRRDRPPCSDTLHALLRALEAVAAEHGPDRLQVWLRHTDPDDIACAGDAGYAVDRRLAVLGRSLEGLHHHPWRPDASGTSDDDTIPRGWRLRAYRPDTDDEEVVRVLREAYEDTPDGGWTVEQLCERRDYDWFEAEDLLLAVDDDGRVGGLHWTKRRDEHTGEVYNLAVSPHAQGHGLGAALLHAGLHHLRDRGCDEVLLWVDLSNERAVRLYASQGFHTRWEDVALTRWLGHRR